ncbi:hypothetical protein QJS04_geneDACA009317 [Acorus gramineus]|uniref:Protein SCAI n=1 Tax=Acorus gramineus TaxID=55184 RepID=A0AAV9AIU0_ACOGR|nr:hypothetical protein QJS04_geneDACA009317 [Acorus gramineus]
MGDVARTFRTLVDGADRKFALVRDIPPHACGRAEQGHSFRKVFKAYTRLWRFQQENRAELVESGLKRWEIGEIASRIGQLYYDQYLRTSEARFLLEAYVFYEAILNRRYFEGGGGGSLGLRFKELRFFARFIVVSLVLSQTEKVRVLVERFKALVEDSKNAFSETNFKEWKQLVQEILRFLKADTTFKNARPLRYSKLLDSHPSSNPYIARYHSKKSLKLQDALLTSYHRNEVKFAEFTLDTFRMLRCLEWEPSGSFYQMNATEPKENGTVSDLSGASGLIDINLAADMTDPNLPPNPRKAILHRPSVSHLIAVVATICEELPPDRILLIYISASGKPNQNFAHEKEFSGALGKSSKMKNVSFNCLQPPVLDDDCSESCLSLGTRGSRGSNTLYPGDLIPFTRKPLFLIIDSESSHAFKVIHGAEREEMAALLLSPGRQLLYSPSTADTRQHGSLFTFFLTAPLQAFSQLVGLPSDTETDTYKKADDTLASAISEWEVILCTSHNLDQVWAQVLTDPFLRRLILRFIFCRSVLYFFCPPEKGDEHLPECLPELPDSVSPTSTSVQSNVFRLADCLGVVGHFNFRNAIGSPTSSMSLER